MSTHTMEVILYLSLIYIASVLTSPAQMPCQMVEAKSHSARSEAFINTVSENQILKIKEN